MLLPETPVSDSSHEQTQTWILLWYPQETLPIVRWCLTQSLFLSALSAEYAENLGDGKNQEFRESEQKRILDLLENF